MYCTSCGNKLAEGSRFCEKCGKACEVRITDNDIKAERTSGLTTRDSETGQNHDAGMQTGTLWIQSFIGHIDDVMNKLELDKWQRAVSIIAACAVLAFLICITGNLVGWISTIAGIMLLICCLKKKKVDSMEMAITWTVFAMRFVIMDAGALSGKYFVNYNLPTVAMRMLIYATVVVYWLMITGQIKIRPLANSLILTFFSAMLCYTVIKFFMVFSNGFRSTLFYLGWSGFMVCYIILFGRDEDTIYYMKANFNITNLKMKLSANGDNSSQASVLNDNNMKDGFFCIFCGKHLSADAVFCEYCGKKVEKKTREEDPYKNDFERSVPLDVSENENPIEEIETSEAVVSENHVADTEEEITEKKVDET